MDLPKLQLNHRFWTWQLETSTPAFLGSILLLLSVCFRLGSCGILLCSRLRGCERPKHSQPPLVAAAVQKLVSQSRREQRDTDLPEVDQDAKKSLRQRVAAK